MLDWIVEDSVAVALAPRSTEYSAVVCREFQRDPTATPDWMGDAEGPKVVDAGPLDRVVTAEGLSETFGLALRLDRAEGRFTARRAA